MSIETAVSIILSEITWINCFVGVALLACVVGMFYLADRLKKQEAMMFDMYDAMLDLYDYHFNES